MEPFVVPSAVLEHADRPYWSYTSLMEFEFSHRIFMLPNAKRMLVEPSGVRITDKNGKTILEYPKKEVWFDRSLSKGDRLLLSNLKIGR